MRLFLEPIFPLLLLPADFCPPVTICPIIRQAQSVSNGLMAAEELSKLFGKYLEVTAVISDERMYQVVGKAV